MPLSAMVQTNHDDRLDTVWLNARLATLVEDAQDLELSSPARSPPATDVSLSQARRASFRPPRIPLSGASIAKAAGSRPPSSTATPISSTGATRAHEFEMRLAGASYEQIAREGGGILSTVRATCAASEDELTRSALKRLDALIAEGVGTVEVKSGYGLNLAAERKSLPRRAPDLANQRDVAIRATFLGAHALPPEFAGKRDEYIAYVADMMIPTLAGEGLIDAVDGFCETHRLHPRRDRARVRRRAPPAGLPVKLHADQLSNSGGGVARGQVRRAVGRSSGICGRGRPYRDGGRRGRRSVTARRLLYAHASYARLRSTSCAKHHIAAGHRHRFQSGHVADDLDPARAQYGGDLVRAHGRRMPRRRDPQRGARAGPRPRRRERSKPGKWADLAIWDIDRPAELVYRLGFNPLHARVWRGR